MVMYLVNILLLILWALFLLKNKNVLEGKKLFVVFASIQWIFLSGLRHLSIGADTMTYFMSFINIEDRSWNYVLDNFYKIMFLGAEGKDPGYAVFEKTIHIFTHNHQSFLIIIAVIFMVPFGLWVYKNSSDVFISFLLYSCLFYAFFAITGHRQTITTALVVLFGYKFIKERKLIPFIILTLVSFTIHKSAIIFFPFYFLANKTITRKYIVIITVLLPILYIFKYDFSRIVKLVAGYEEYGVYQNAGTWTFSALMILIFLIAIWRKSIILKLNSNAVHYYNALFVAMVFLPLTFVNPSAMRVVQYFSVFIMLLIPDIINSFKGKEKVLVYYLVTSILILFFIRSNPDYMFFWQE